MESVVDHKADLLDHGDIDQAETQEVPIEETREGEAGEAIVAEETGEGIAEEQTGGDGEATDDVVQGDVPTEQVEDSAENGVTAEEGGDAEITEAAENGETVAETDATEGGEYTEENAGGEGEAEVAEGEVAEGEVAEGEAVEGEGETAEGEGAVEGEAAEGEVAEGEVAEGEVAEGEVAEGEVAEGEVAEGEAAEGEGIAEGEAEEGGDDLMKEIFGGSDEETEHQQQATSAGGEEDEDNMEESSRKLQRLVKQRLRKRQSSDDEAPPPPEDEDAPEEEQETPKKKKKRLSKKKRNALENEEEGEGEGEVSEKKKKKKKKKKAQAEGEGGEGGDVGEGVVGEDANDEDDAPKRRRRDYDGDMPEFDAAMARLKPKRPRKEMTPDEETKLIEAVNEFIIKMEAAAELDQEANREKKPATHKIASLKHVSEMLHKARFANAFVSQGGLTAIRKWLQPLPDKSLPSLNIREQLLEVLFLLPFSKDALQTSEVGKIVMFLYKEKTETTKNKRLCGQIIEKWSRPLFGLHTAYKDRDLRGEDEDELERPIRRSRGEEEENEIDKRTREQMKDNRKFHARIPQRISMDFKRQPVSNDLKQPTTRSPHAAAAEADRILKKKRKIQPSTTNKVLRAEKVSVEGRGVK